MSAPATPPSRSRRSPLAWRRLFSPRLWVFLAITAVWVMMMSRLWVRERGGSGLSLRQMGISPEVLLVSWTDYEQWLWIEQQGRRIGLATLRIAPLTTREGTQAAPADMPGYGMDSRTRLTVTAMGFQTPVEMATHVTTNPAFELQTLQGVIRLAGQRLRLDAFVEPPYLFYRVGLAPDDEPTSSSRPGRLFGLDALAALNPLQVALGQLPRGELCGRAPLTEPIFLSDAVIPVLTRNDSLGEGQRWVTRAANPLAGLTQSEIRIEVEGRETLRLAGQEPVETWRLNESFADVNSTVWYDTRGRIVQRDLDGHMRMTMASPSQAMEAYPEFKRALDFPPLDRQFIREHLDPRFDGTPLDKLLPQLPMAR